MDNTRTLFVHVPDISIYPSDQTAKALERILDLTWEQVKAMDSAKELSDKLENANLNSEWDFQLFLVSNWFKFKSIYF